MVMQRWRRALDTRCCNIWSECSREKQCIDTLPDVVPFLFDEEMHTQPTRFDFIFVYKGKKYQYGFSADKYRIMEEYLYAYESSEAKWY